MKILIVRMWADYLNIKNYNCQELGLARALVRKNNQCDIVLYTDVEKEDEDIWVDNLNKKIHIYYLKGKKLLKNVFYQNRLYEIAKDYDIVQTTEYDQIGNVKLGKKVHSKMIIYHGPYLSSYTKGYHKKCILSDIYYFFHKKYKEIPCITKSNLASKLLEKKGFKNITTIGVGLDSERFHDVGEMDEKIKELQYKKSKENLRYMLYIGKIEERRNIKFLIDILQKSIQYNPQIRLLIIGTGNEKYFSECVEYAKQKGVYDKIIYYKSFEQNKLPYIYKCCDLFLLPTYYEIFGMVLLEAMYFGLPVITTLNGGSSTLIKNEKNGMICDLNDLNEWIEAIMKCLNNEIYMESISKNAQQFVKNNFTWDKIVDKFIEVYNHIYDRNLII